MSRTGRLRGHTNRVAYDGSLSDLDNSLQSTSPANGVLEHGSVRRRQIGPWQQVLPPLALDEGQGGDVHKLGADADVALVLCRRPLPLANHEPSLRPTR